MSTPVDVLLVSAGVVHPPLTGWIWLWRFLTRRPEFRARRVRSLEVLPRTDLRRYRALVLYYHHDVISDAALGALDTFISGGGGALAIHSATASFKEAQRYFEILGGRFTGHGPVAPFDVQPASPEDQIFGRIPTFAVKDELYLHELVSDIDVHFLAEYEGEPVPVVWTRRHGRGRVCYACPGHRTQSLQVPGMQQILRRGLTWACGEGGT
jgi:type 1 glutamine amidotransferase